MRSDSEVEKEKRPASQNHTIEKKDENKELEIEENPKLEDENLIDNN